MLKIADCAKDGIFYQDAPRSNYESLTILAIGIRSKNTKHLGKKFLVVIFSAIVYFAHFGKNSSLSSLGQSSVLRI